MGLNTELDGFTIVSIEQAVAAPYCGLLLADAGARVIKIERPDGDFARGYDAGANGQSAIFAWLNRSKQSVCLDLKNRADMSALKSALRHADVLISNLAPGALDRLSLTGHVLRQENPGLITCAISGYGDTDAAAQKKAYDFLVQGESGICAVTGTQEAPARVGIPLTDLATGLTAFSAILRALLQRGRTGVGVDLNIAMFDVMADWMNMPLLTHRYMGCAPARAGLKHTFIAPYGAFECGDGVQVLLSIQSNREFKVFCEQVLNQADLAQDARFAENTARYENRVILDGIVTKRFASFSASDVLAMLDIAGIANAQLNSVADVSDHPALKNAAAVIGGTEIQVAALPIQGDALAPIDVPDLGQHTAEFLAEFPPESA